MAPQAAGLSGFMLPMLEYVPERRATAAQMLQHPWLRGDPTPPQHTSQLEQGRAQGDRGRNRDWDTRECPEQPRRAHTGSRSPPGHGRAAGEGGGAEGLRTRTSGHGAGVAAGGSGVGGGSTKPLPPSSLYSRYNGKGSRSRSRSMQPPHKKGRKYTRSRSRSRGVASPHQQKQQQQPRMGGRD